MLCYLLCYAMLLLLYATLCYPMLVSCALWRVTGAHQMDKLPMILQLIFVEEQERSIA